MEEKNYSLKIASSARGNEESTLCEACQRVLLQVLEPVEDSAARREIPHQESLAAMETAAAEACVPCTLLLPGFSETWRRWSERDRVNEKPPHTAILRMVERLDPEVAKMEFGTLWARFFCITQGGSMTRLADIGFERTEHGPPGVLGRSTTSRPDFGVARVWISECSMHAGCSYVRNSPLPPKRLIDVGLKNERCDPKLVFTAGLTDQYLALSYCRESSSQAKILAKIQNRTTLLEAVPWETMPKTFQDAVVVTRELGYRFLWIDVYCTEQDNHQDRQHDNANVTAIYENASITIAASSAADLNSGFLHERPTWQTNVAEWARHHSLEPEDPRGKICPLSFRMESLAIRSIVTSIPGNEEAGFPNNYFLDRKNDLLAESAYSVPERLLSPRILNFYDNQMVFECNACIRYERLHHGITHRDGEYERDDRITLAPKDFLNTDDPDEIILRWYDILQRYTMCKITMADDRLPALSGIAARISERTGNAYVAGLWRTDMIRGLSWRARVFPEPYMTKLFGDHIETSYGDTNLGTSKAEQPATLWTPSWSWAACEMPIRVLDDSGPMDGGAEVVAVTSMPLGLNPFGHVASAQLTLAGHLRDVEWRVTHSDPAETLFLQTGDNRWIGPFHPDRFLSHSTTLNVGDHGALALLLLSDGGFHCIALVLERLQSPPDTYRRVGLLTTNCYTSWSVQPQNIMRPLEVLTWLKEGDRQSIHLV